MNAYTLEGVPISSALVSLPSYGIWRAQVSITDAKVLAVGSSVSLALGSLTLSGTIRDGGAYQGRASYRVVGGADGWPRVIPCRAYASRSGVHLSEVASDLASEVGERIVVEPGVEPLLGASWARLEGPASVALDSLAPSWWVAADGVTHLGKRPVVDVQLGHTLLDYDPSRRRLQTAVRDEAMGLLAPGIRFKTDFGQVRAVSIGIRVCPEHVVTEMLHA